MKKKATEEAKKTIKKSTAYDLVNRSGIDPCLPVSVNSKLDDLVTKLCVIHRVPVLDHDGRLVSTLSQSSIIQYVYKNYSKVEKEFSGKSLLDMGLAKNKTIYGVNLKDDVLNCLTLIEKYEVSALPILDDNGKVVGNFSSTDLRKFLIDEWMNFSLTVEKYIEKYSSLQNFTIKQNESFSNLIKFFAEGINDIKYHRFWVVNDEGKPISCVTMTDIMRYIRDLPVDE